MAYREINPFAPPAGHHRRRSVMDMHPRGRTPEEVAAEESFRRREKEKLGGYERLHTILDLNRYLNERPNGGEACVSRFDCDPWKYEPLLLDDLIKARSQNAPQTRIDELRGLIRAGSWMTYPRTGQSGALQRLREVAQSEEDGWQAKIRQADPDTSRELKADMQEMLQELRQVTADLAAGKTGPELEAAVRAVEDLNARAWLSLKGYMAARGGDLAETKKQPAARPLVEEIERLRLVRDLLYFRRLYPKWAKLSLVSPETAVSP